MTKPIKDSGYWTKLLKKAVEDAKSKKEADSSSSVVQVTRDGVAKQSECEVRFLVKRIREANPSPDIPNRNPMPTANKLATNFFEVVLIEEGLGNSKDLFYYPGETITEAADVFLGKKIYADHPSSEEEVIRPERSVRDILGYFERVEPFQSEDGRTCLKGTVKMVMGQEYDWARQLMQEAVQFSEKFEAQDFVGLSVNASGEAQEVEISSLLDDPGVPEPAKAKLLKAVKEGATTIRKVSAITDAVSCDLVTEAGAGGKVLAMIEQEKKMRKKNLIENESEMKHSDKDEKDPKDMKKEDEAATPKGEHPDEEQDKKLIGDMVKKYLGDGEHTEEDMQMAGECIKHAKDMGMEGDEAMKCAGYHMKMMKHLAKKEAEKKHKEDEAKKEAESHKEDEAETKETAPPPTKAKPTEAAITELEADKVALAGRVAKLEEENRKFKLDIYLDKKLKESGLSRKATDTFRKGLTAVRNEKDIDEKFILFTESYKLGLQEANTSPYVLSVEKNIEITESKQEAPTYDLSKFVR